MKKVYVFTKEGRKFSTDGLNMIKKFLAENFQEYEEPTFMMGEILNDKSAIIPDLKKNAGNMYIVVSEDGGQILHYLDLEASSDILRLGFLEKDMSEKTWDTLLPIMYDLREIHAGENK